MKIKSFVRLALIIFFVSLAAILFFGFFIQPVKNPPVNSLQNNGTQAISPAGKIISSIEVAKHNSSASCWVIIKNKVYDLTSFINVHSGGSDVILQNCGKDGTIAFNTKDKNPPRSHSQSNKAILDSYYIGDLTAAN